MGATSTRRETVKSSIIIYFHTRVIICHKHAVPVDRHLLLVSV